MIKIKYEGVEILSCETEGEAISQMMITWGNSDKDSDEFLEDIEIIGASSEEENYIREEFYELAEENLI